MARSDLVDDKPRRRLEARVHTAFDGIPYYDAELDVAQSNAHRHMVHELCTILSLVANEAEGTTLSDEPIWFLHPETDKQKVFYGDCVLAAVQDTSRITADELLLVIEVVTTSDRRKELKDTRFQRLLNEYNNVPEFALVFPELDDPRALTFCRLVEGSYQAVEIAPGGRVESQALPGLVFEVRAPDTWELGRKLNIYYQGELRRPLAHEKARADEERARADEEHARADEERARADEERARADEEHARAERLAKQLRELGIDPD